MILCHEAILSIFLLVNKISKIMLKVVPYSITSVGHVVSFPTKEITPLASTKLRLLVTVAHRCK